MIDIHSHILPGLDDGASSMEMSLAMARVAVRDGIYTMIATPHHMDGHYENEYEEVRAACSRLNDTLTNEGIPLRVLTGQEIRVTPKLIEQIQQGTSGTLTGSRYLLLELPGDHIPAYLDELLHELAILNLVPILAHPERNLAFLMEPHLLRKYVDKGVLVQLSAQSMTGKYGRRLQRLAVQCCKSRCAHFIASDAHNLETRPAHLSAAYNVLKHVAGSKCTASLQKNGETLIEHGVIASLDTLDMKKKWFVF